ncbi:MAG: hypothetical protein E7618_02355 [Ruminococcaceae bacterium]|nr:hypothetical protein [Oscillospiraceae bacterium]
MKKLSLILAALLLFTALASACSQAGPGASATTDDVTLGGSDTDGASTSERDTTFEDHVPDNLTYGGYDFVMAFPNPADHGKDYQIVDEGFAVTKIDEAVYRRNRTIEDRFDIVLSGITGGNSDTQTPFLETTVLSGDDAIDLAFIAFTYSGIPWITSGYAMPWNDVEHIDTSRVYWNQSMIDNLSIAGHTFLLQGDINWPSMNSTQVCFFNTTVVTDNKVGNLYETVRNGDWTFDRMKTLARNFAKDLNQDGNYDETDQYGIAMCFYGAVYEIGIAANYLTVIPTEDGFTLNVDTDKFADIVNYAYDLIYNHGTTYIERYDYIEESKGVGIFFDNRAMFMLTGLGTGNYFRNEKADYGIIPCPKYDEFQEKYCTTNDQWGLSCSIPTTATDPARTGAITEALCALSGKIVYPTYYEDVLSERNTRDEESKQMLELIFSNIIYDPGITFGTAEAYVPLYKLVKDKSSDVASWSARYGGKIQSKFDDLFEYVTDNYD